MEPLSMRATVAAQTSTSINLMYKAQPGVPAQGLHKYFLMCPEQKAL